MARHALTSEQMQKFVDSIHGVCDSEIAGGQFTTNELVKLAVSVGGLNDWPKVTDDPEVNFAVDCVVHDDEELFYDEQQYAEEIEAFRNIGAFDERSEA